MRSLMWVDERSGEICDIFSLKLDVSLSVWIKYVRQQVWNVINRIIISPLLHQCHL